MIFGAKIVIILETKEYFTYNLVVWRIFIWSFGEFSFGYLALLCLIFGANVPCISHNQFGLRVLRPDGSHTIVPLLWRKFVHLSLE